MEFIAPTTWADALAAKAEFPDAVPITGGTDVMVDLNFDRQRPSVLLDLTRIPELAEWSRVDERPRVPLIQGMREAGSSPIDFPCPSTPTVSTHLVADAARDQWEVP